MGNASRGSGAGGRSQDLFEDMPSDWTCEEKKAPGGKIYLTFTSPCGKMFFSPSDAREFISQQLRRVAESDDSSSDYFPSPEKRRVMDAAVQNDEETPCCSKSLDNPQNPQIPVEVPNNMFVGQGICVENLIQQINATSRCATENCQGKTCTYIQC